MQVLPGIYQINGSVFGRHQNSYLVHKNSTTVLIDSGDLEDAETLPEVQKNAARWDLDIRNASHLLITHAHFDHASHAAALQRCGVKVVASPETADAMSFGDERCIGYAVQRTFEKCVVDIILKDEDDLEINDLKFRGLAAPGHTDGLMIYELHLAGERLWFVGDLLEAVHAHRGVNLPWTGAPDFDRGKYIQSLARLLKQPPCDHLFPGHGPAAIGCGRRVLEMLYTEAMVKWR